MKRLKRIKAWVDLAGSVLRIVLQVVEFLLD